MALRQLPLPRFHFTKTNGDPASGYLVNAYEPGTTTRKNTYTDSTGDTANANPVVLNSRGEAAIWWDGTYKVVITDASGVTIYTEDNYGEGLDPVAVPQLSLVKNYSFEEASTDPDEPDNWTVTLYTNGTQTLDTSAGNQIHGAQAIKFTSAGSGGGYAESDLFPVQEAEALSISIAIKSSVADVRNLIEIVWYDRAEALLSTDSLYDDSTTNPTSWTDQDLSATPPSDARFAKLRLTGCHSSDATVGSTWFDNVRSVALGTVILASPVLSGTVTGTYTLAGTPTISSPTINTPTIATPVLSGTATGTGTLGGSIVVPLARMQRTEVTNENSGVVNLTGSGAVDSVVTADCGTVNSGDRIFVQAFALCDRSAGGGAGTCTPSIRKESGTATVEFYHDDATQIGGVPTAEIPASGSNFRAPVFGIVKVTGTGTLVLNLTIQDVGASGGNVDAGEAQIHAIVLNNG